MITRLRKKIQSIPDRKRYIDFIAALFGIPVMATVLLINLGNINKDDPQPTASASETIIVQTTPNQLTTPPQEQPTDAQCRKKVGPIEITAPEEGQRTSSNPVNIIINYDDEEYCTVVWSYRINGGEWSEFTNNTIALFNPPQGMVSLDLRVQSTVSRDKTELNRTFEYVGLTQETSTPSAQTTSNPFSGP